MNLFSKPISEIIQDALATLDKIDNKIKDQINERSKKNEKYNVICFFSLIFLLSILSIQNKKFSNHPAIVAIAVISIIYFMLAVWIENRLLQEDQIYLKNIAYTIHRNCTQFFLDPQTFLIQRFNNQKLSLRNCNF